MCLLFTGTFVDIYNVSRTTDHLGKLFLCALLKVPINKLRALYFAENYAVVQGILIIISLCAEIIMQLGSVIIT